MSGYEAMIEEVRFAEDSPLEEGGFELVVPLCLRIDDCHRGLSSVPSHGRPVSPEPIFELPALRNAGVHHSLPLGIPAGVLGGMEVGKLCVSGYPC
jgi:hypothetical protein